MILEHEELRKALTLDLDALMARASDLAGKLLVGPNCDVASAHEVISALDFMRLARVDLRGKR